MDHYRQFIKSFAQIAQPLNEHLVRDGAGRKSEWVFLSDDALLKMDASKEGLGAVLSQKQADGWFHLVAYGSWALTAHEKNYHSTNLEFLALK